MAATRKGRTQRKKPAVGLSPAEAFTEAKNRITQLPERAKRLDLSGLKQLTEIPEEIKRLAALETLELRGTQITSLARVASLPHLRVLQVPHCPIDSLKPLTRCESLEILDISQTKVSNLDPIADHRLTHLTLQGCPIGALAAYPFLRSLIYLNVDKTPLQDIKALSQTKLLAFLYADKTSIDDLSPIASIEQLQEIKFSETRVSNLDALSDLIYLEKIKAQHTRIRDLVLLQKLELLNWLDISGTDVSDLSPIASLRNIVSLDISETSVISLHPIANYERLKNLDASDSDLGDIDAVGNIVSLIPKSVGELHGWSGFRYVRTPAARRSPFGHLLRRDWEGVIQTVETINLLRRARGLPEVYPADYERNEEVGSILAQISGVNDAELLQQRPATYGFVLRNGRIEGEPRILPSSNDALTKEIYSAVVSKIARAKERLNQSNAPARIRRSIEETARVLGDSFVDVQAGALLMSYRSIEADCEAYNTPSGRRELPEDTLAILIDMASSLEDLMSCYPGLAEIEAERLAQRIQSADVPRLMQFMAEMRKNAASSDYVGKSAVDALRAGQGAVDQLTETIEGGHSTHSEIAYALQARSKLVGQKLLDYRNFVAGALRYAGSGIGQGAAATAAGLGKFGKETLREVGERGPKAIGKGVAKGLEKSSEVAVKVGLAALVTSIAGAVAGVGMFVASFIPLGTKAAAIEGQVGQDMGGKAEVAVDAQGGYSPGGRVTRASGVGEGS